MITVDLKLPIVIDDGFYLSLYGYHCLVIFADLSLLAAFRYTIPGFAGSRKAR